MTLSSGLRVAVGTAVNLTVIAAGFAPVPGLSALAGLVDGILKLCDGVRISRNEVRGLGKRCDDLLHILQDKAGSNPDNLQTMLDAADKLLRDIKDTVAVWAKKSYFRLVFMRDEIAGKVKRYHNEINSFLETFNLAAQIEIIQRLMTFDQQRQEDKEDLIMYLSDVRNEGRIKHEAIIAKYDEIKGVMEVMQETMASFPITDERHIGLGRNLYAIQEASGQLPPRIELKAGEARRISNHPVQGSAVFDIWEGVYLGKEKCAIKAVRSIEVSPKTRERLLREVRIWRKVWEDDKGEHVLPFWGACFDDGPYPYVVSPWMDYGDATSYVNKYPNVNRKRIIRRIAEGIKLLHSYDPPIAHGDIKGANILIDHKGNPLLSDFGFSKMVENLTGVPFTQSTSVSESYRWLAPELCSEPGVMSPASDVFAYSFTISQPL